jgi:hypothetical protein
MGRSVAWALGVGLGLVLSAAPAAAQTHINVGVWTPNVGAHVVVGAPRVYAPRPVYIAQPRVYVVERDHRYGRGRPPGRGWGHGRKHTVVTRVYEVQERPYGWGRYPQPVRGYGAPAHVYHGDSRPVYRGYRK